jgi:hypothetical protein
MPTTAPAPALPKECPPGRRDTLLGRLAAAGAAGLVLLTAACGGSPRAGAASSPSASATSRLAFVRCVRVHGVPNYPDPQSNGLEPPGTKQLFLGDPRFPAAVDTCSHLLPAGGQPTQAPLHNDLTESGALRLARCVRAHGYPAFPDPISNADGQPVFNVQAAGIAPHSPRLLGTLRRCLSLLHLTGLPSTSS